MMDHSASLPRRGDVNGLFAILIDNTAALVLLFTLLASTTYRIDRFSGPFVLAWIIPGTVVGVMVCGILYAVMAILLARRSNGAATSVPMGLDTPSVVALSIFVLIPALKEGRDLLGNRGLDEETLHYHASTFAWHVGAVLLIFTGVFKMAIAPFAESIRRLVPRAALLGSLAAVALALIAFIPLSRHVGPAPLVGLPVLMIVLVTLLVRRGVGAIPGSAIALGFGLIVVILGIVSRDWFGIHALPLPEISLLEGGAVPPLPTESWDGAWWNSVIGSALAKLPATLPFALFTVVGGIQCAESARAAGDDYDARTITFVQGLASAVGGIFGGVVQTTPYFGHPAYKQMGAGWIYAVAGAAALMLAGYFGWFARFFEFLPGGVVFPIIIYVGLRTIAHSFEATSPRDYAALAFAALPVFAYLIVISIDEIYRDTPPSQSGAVLLQALRCLGNGFILTSLLWATALAALLEGQPIRAALCLAIGALCSLFGLMHSPLPNAPLALPTDIWQELATASNPRMQFMSPFHWAGGYALAALIVLADAYLLRQDNGSDVPADLNVRL